MTEVTPHPPEEGATPTPPEGGAAEVEQVLDFLSKDEEGAESDFDKRLTRLEKGIHAAFSKGLIPTKTTETKAPQSSEEAVILKNLYLGAHPEVEHVWEELQKEAEALKKSPIALYESSSYFKGEAKARAEAKRIEEENKSKVNPPTSENVGAEFDPSSVKTHEQFKKLPPSKMIEVFQKKAEEERRRIR